MSILKIQPTAQAEWYALIHQAHQQANAHLSDELESYLISLLMRFMQRSDFVDSVVALEYLQSQQQTGEQRREQLRDVGDKCLLFAGLFPGRANRANLKISYFVDIGKSAYGYLSEVTSAGLSSLFQALSCHFVSLMDVLQVIRGLAKESPALMPIEAYDLWMDTNSQQAEHCLQQYASGEAVIIKGPLSKH